MNHFKDINFINFYNLFNRKYNYISIKCLNCNTITQKILEQKVTKKMIKKMLIKPIKCSKCATLNKPIIVIGDKIYESCN